MSGINDLGSKANGCRNCERCIHDVIRPFHVQVTAERINVIITLFIVIDKDVLSGVENSLCGP